MWWVERLREDNEFSPDFMLVQASQLDFLEAGNRSYAKSYWTGSNDFVRLKISHRRYNYYVRRLTGRLRQHLRRQGSLKMEENLLGKFHFRLLVHRVIGKESTIFNLDF